MKGIYLVVFLIFATQIQAQVQSKDSLLIDYDAVENDSLLAEILELEEVVIYRNKLDAAAAKDFLLLQNRVYVVYPYAKIAADRLTILNATMDKMKTAKEKRKYFKIVETYIEGEFTGKLKKLSRKQGQILVKLAYRQTGITLFDLVKDQKSSWKAFWANNTAKLFDIDIKRGYDPYSVNEDYLIETILQRAFESGRLPNQAPAIPIDYNNLDKHWHEMKSAEKNK